MSCEPTPCNNTSTSSWCTMCGGHSLSRPQMTTDPNLALGYPIPIMIKTRYSCEMFSFSVDSHSQPPVLKWNRLFLASFPTTTSELYSCAVKNTHTLCSTIFAIIARHHVDLTARAAAAEGENVIASSTASLPWI